MKLAAMFLVTAILSIENGCNTPSRSNALDAAMVARADIVCKRAANQSHVKYLEKAAGAAIYKREYNYDSRIRFFNKSKKQIETCSTIGGDDNKYECFGASGPHGEGETVVMNIEVESENERAGYLHYYKNPFRLKVRPAGLQANAAWLVFECARNGRSDEE